MISLAILAAIAFGTLSVVGWVFKLCFHIVGWSLRLILGVVFLPLILVFVVAGGLAALGAFIIPVAAVAFAIMLIANLAGLEG